MILLILVMMWKLRIFNLFMLLFNKTFSLVRIMLIKLIQIILIFLLIGCILFYNKKYFSFKYIKNLFVSSNKKANDHEEPYTMFEDNFNVNVDDNDEENDNIFNSDYGLTENENKAILQALNNIH